MNDDWLTTTEAAELLAQLTGRPLRRQRLQQLCGEGRLLFRDVEVVRQERRISKASIEQLAREGLPRRRGRCGHLDIRVFSHEHEDFRGRDLRGVSLRGAQLQGRDFTGADLRNADLRGAFLKEAVFCKADLRGADLSGSMLDGADFTGARLDGCNLASCSLEGADLSVQEVRPMA